MMNEKVPTDEDCMYKPSSGERKDCTKDPSVCSEYQQCCQVACENKKMCSQKPYRPSFRSDYIMPGNYSAHFTVDKLENWTYIDNRLKKRQALHLH